MSAAEMLVAELAAALADLADECANGTEASRSAMLRIAAIARDIRDQIREGRTVRPMTAQPLTSDAAGSAMVEALRRYADRPDTDEDFMLFNEWNGRQTEAGEFDGAAAVGFRAGWLAALEAARVEREALIVALDATQRYFAVLYDKAKCEWDKDADALQINRTVTHTTLDELYEDVEAKTAAARALLRSGREGTP